MGVILLLMTTRQPTLDDLFSSHISPYKEATLSRHWFGEQQVLTGSMQNHTPVQSQYCHVFLGDALPSGFSVVNS